MAGSSFGTIFRITTWGESHGPSIGVVVDGCPAGLFLSEEDIQMQLNRRRPGQSRYSTPRNEADRVHSLSGIFEGRTTGTPIAMEVINETQRSKDYSEIANSYRPGHADYTFDQKYGFRDYRGGGRSSGRETIGRVAGGAVAMKLLEQLGISITAYASSIGPVAAKTFCPEEIDNNPFHLPDAEAAAMAQKYVDRMMEEKESSGGVIECRITGVPLVSIGAVKGIEIGDGFAAAHAVGSENNDSFYINEDGNTAKKTNHAGGILGGISDGDTIIVRAAVKPTPSIFRPQQTISRNKEPMELTIKGRHDPLIVPRAVVVVEAMCALTIADSLLLNMTAQMDGVLRFYNK